MEQATTPAPKFTETLINIVREYPCLYDPSNKDFKNHYKKNNIWKHVGAALNVECDYAKSRWRAVRDNYTRHKKASKGVTGQAAGSAKKGGWLEQLRFLEDVWQPRGTNSNVSPAQPTASAPFDVVILPDLAPMSPEPTYTPESSTTPVGSCSYDGSMEATTSATPVPSRKRKLEEASEVHKMKQFLRAREPEDADDHLFKYYAKTMKTFDQDIKLELKNAIHKAFSDAEFKQIARPNK